MSGDPSQSDPAAPRLKPSGRRTGDSGTRRAITDAARRQFSQHGYDRTSLRSVAREAGVDPALVAHFYGTKPQLFATVIQLPFDPHAVLPRVLKGPRSQIGKRLAEFVLDTLEQAPQRERILALIRSAASEPEAAEIVRGLIERELFTAIAEHLGSDQPRLRASFVGAQVVGLVMARHVVAVEPITSADRETVASMIAPNLQRLLTGPLPNTISDVTKTDEPSQA